MASNNLGLNQENINRLADSIKYLPKSLNQLILNLSRNNLGQITNYLLDSLKYLPCNLERLTLLLIDNNIGGNLYSMESLGTIFN